MHSHLLMCGKIKKSHRGEIYRVAGLLGRINVWRIAKLKVVGEKMVGKWIDIDHKNTNHTPKFDLLKFGKPHTICQIRQISHCLAFLLYGNSFSSKKSRFYLDQFAVK